MTSKLHRRKSLAADTRGSVAVQFGLAAVMIMLVAGSAIDSGRWFLAKRLTAAAMDAGVLAGARALQLSPADVTGALAAAQSMYDNNILQRMAVESDSISFAAADNNTAITATGTAYIRTTLLNLTGIHHLPIIDLTGASFPKASIAVGGMGGTNLEVSVMLDLTGSMCDDGSGPCASGVKVDGLKAAATDLVNIVVSTDQSKYSSRAALVPFSTRVRVGPDVGTAPLMRTLTDLDPVWSGYRATCTSWTPYIPPTGTETVGSGGDCLTSVTNQVSNQVILPCISDRYYDTTGTYELTDVAPGHGTWFTGHDGTRTPLSGDSEETALTSNTGATSSDPSWNWNYDTGAYCEDTAPGNMIMPLTTDKSALLARINGLTAQGGTAGALATAMAWYMVSPNWHTVWTGTSRPAPYSDLTTLQPSGAPKLRKVAVLMTDGGFNAFRSWKGQDQQMVSDWAVQLCTNMKAQGVEVYTVGFALNQLLPAERAIATAALQACGSDISHFYNTLTVPQLKQAFRDIAVTMTSLYLSR